MGMGVMYSITCFPFIYSIHLFHSFTTHNQPATHNNTQQHTTHNTQHTTHNTTHIHTQTYTY